MTSCEADYAEAYGTKKDKVAGYEPCRIAHLESHRSRSFHIALYTQVPFCMQTISSPNYLHTRTLRRALFSAFTLRYYMRLMRRSSCTRLECL